MSNYYTTVCHWALLKTPQLYPFAHYCHNTLKELSHKDNLFPLWVIDVIRGRPALGNTLYVKKSRSGTSMYYMVGLIIFMTEYGGIFIYMVAIHY